MLCVMVLAKSWKMLGEFITSICINLRKFNYTLQLINSISSNLQKLPKYVNGTVSAAFF